jgi:hypothetical protein
MQIFVALALAAFACCVFGVLSGRLSFASLGSRSLMMRIPIAVIALAVLAFCGFGFLATYEPPGFMAWRIGYGIAGAACLGVVTWALISGKPSA